MSSMCSMPMLSRIISGSPRLALPSTVIGRCVVRPETGQTTGITHIDEPV